MATPLHDRLRAFATEGEVFLLPAPDLSIVVPAFNEAQRLPGTLSAIYAHLEQVPYTAEVVVVDDGSTDNTVDFVRGVAGSYPRLRLLRNGRNRGKGYSVKHGVLQSQGRYVLFTDADLSTPIGEVDRLLPLLEQGWDVVVGSRDLDPRLLEGPQPWLRRQAGQVFHLVVRALMGLPIHDTQCGFKLFHRQAALRLFRLQQIERFGFDVEILWLAQRLGLRCLETGVVWVNDARSRVSMLRDGPAMLWELLRIRWRGWRNAYAEDSLSTEIAPLLDEPWLSKREGELH
ncbi:MAG TPA: dolichyl-phosphate beta-glucosyltransferase [Candidatus Acidoferrales bacterium]|nr:dolichyl-phosphate beta-glucosyltransferase [Candidatus Acidoferrales bacterium]